MDIIQIDIVFNGVSELPEVKNSGLALKWVLSPERSDKVVGYIGSFTRCFFVKEYEFIA